MTLFAVVIIQTTTKGSERRDCPFTFIDTNYQYCVWDSLFFGSPIINH